MKLPKEIKRVSVPPIKCQGIKTKLVPFIMSSIRWSDANGTWIEPFAGSGVVVFNVKPQRAIINDANPFIIGFYKAIYDGTITPEIVRDYLRVEGRTLLLDNRKGTDSYFYRVRERFNETGSLLDFLFLSRSCFNGVMRFNGKGKFNVPFCQKPDRFRQAYITKITNQVASIKKAMTDKDWIFTSNDWKQTIELAEDGDFVYLDPPYIGRHVDYFNHWTEKEAKDLAKTTQALPENVGFALSMWKENKYRVNGHIEEEWAGNVERSFAHYYHIGSTESLRNEMQEALIIRQGCESEEAQVIIE
ncbi:MAG: Dam family site-specific DNA-(adenine-N6)-methyltransferase [Bacteroidetes bacterium]|nr:Dam family site-specific DNA-(adenine-N6)-methyltransferase [Bacteroidota bacterium]